MLAGFFFGYAIGQLPGGLLAERFGGKLVFGLGTFITAVLTVISPFSVWLKEDLFFVVRILEGIAEVSDTYTAVEDTILFYYTSHDPQSDKIVAETNHNASPRNN